MKMLTVGDSHSCNWIWGDTWAEILPDRFGMEPLVARSAGAGNSVYIEKIHHALKTYNDIELVVIQTTEHSRVVTGFEKDYLRPYSHGELTNSQRMNDVLTYTWTCRENGNERNIYNMIKQETKIDDVWSMYIATSIFNEYKYFHDIITIQYICESYGVDCVFFHWFMDITELHSYNDYKWILNNIKSVPSSFINWKKDNNIEAKEDGHYGPEVHELFVDTWLKNEVEKLRITK